MQEAINKLRVEMDGNKDNSYIQVIGDFLLQHIEANPDCAEKITAGDKSIAKSLDAMAAEARKKQHNGIAMLSDSEGFSIVLKYFGVDGDPVPTNTPMDKRASLQTRPEIESSFHVSLDEFL